MIGSEKDIMQQRYLCFFGGREGSSNNFISDIPRNVLKEPEPEIMAALGFQCLCVASAARAWERIETMVDVSFDVIIAASAQAIQLSQQSQKCQLHCQNSAAEAYNTFIHIYGRLVTLLERAITTYATNSQPPPSTTPTFRRTSQGNLTYALDDQALRSVFRDFSTHRPLQEQRSPAAVVCRPSKMILGQYEMDEQQSQYLALDVICRTLRNLVIVLQEMGGGENAEIKQVDARLLTILVQVRRLLENTSATLSSLES
ncbi:hypothetical protein N7447_005043 [Penicillium robsamsonii]|uniref:uncharacterized protein n=1 Tax=Penicillium robsamsonii TaxID=1792511 RepID=UPI0025473736|nr:uncharacterized protein N7447_005043 [Penicillium robsamsonii]KAJ5822703.1 hypothetical protein N7447_005043 [Penicillium robsamsonii]